MVKEDTERFADPFKSIIISRPGKQNRSASPFWSSGLVFSCFVLIASFTGTVILWGTDFFDTAILKVLTFHEGGYIFNLWRKPDYENIIYVYPFNYTNYLNVLDGLEKPHVEELGPYVFRERMEKVNVIFNNNGTLTYSENRTHEFVPELSKGTIDDIVITPNVPLLSAIATGKKKTVLTQIPLAAILRGLDSSPFLHVPVAEFVMGFDDSFSLVARKITAILKEEVPTKFGMLSDRSGLSPDRVTIGTGTPELDRLGMVEVYNGRRRLPYWKDECNTLQGSDGTLFPGRLVEKQDRLYLFVKGLCRRIPIQYQGINSISQGFPAKRFSLPKNVFWSGNDNPENRCFCQGPSCSPRGAFLTDHCNFGSPVVVSFPHFLHGDPALLQNVSGLKPDIEKHDFFFDIHHKLGIPLGCNSALQLSIIVNHCPFIPQFTKVPQGTVLPISWINLKVGDFRGDLYNIIYHATFTVRIIQYLLKWISLVLMISSLFIIVFHINGFKFVYQRVELKS